MSGIDITVIQASKYVFPRDSPSPSTSMAAAAPINRSENGWDTWKATNGKTLDQVKRQPVKETD